MIDFTTNPLIQTGAFNPDHHMDKSQPQRVDYFPGRIREVRDSERCGLPVYLERIRTTNEAEGLRLLYRRIARTCMKTTSSARTNILTLPHYCAAGRPAYLLTGFVSDTHFTPDGHLDRICLTDPCALDPDTGEAFNIDTHIWLFADRLTVTDPGMIHGHAGLAGDLLTISMGDRITLHCCLNVYTKNTRKRIGIDEWFPVDAQLYYADRNGTRRRVPNHIKAGLEILSIHTDGSVTTTSEQDWATRLLAALGRHLDEEQNGRVYEYNVIKTLMPFINAQQFAA